MFALDVGRLFDGERVTRDGAVVMVDQARVLGVLPRGTPVPAGCAVTRFPDATLLPGLIDTHVHLCGDSGPGALDRLAGFDDAQLATIIERALGAHLATGVTTVRDLGDRRGAVLDWRDRNRDDTTLPAVLGSGPPITSPRGHCWNMGGEAADVPALRRAVRERAERGADLVKIMASGGANTPGTNAARPQFGVEELRVVVDQAHALGLSVTAHAHALAAIENALSAEVDALEHCTFITETGVHVSHTVLARLVASQIPVCPTLGIATGASPPPAVQELMRKAGMSYDSQVRTAGELHRAGVRMVSGSDGGISPGKPHGIAPDAIIHLVDGGVSASDALACATSHAAAACAIANRKGRVSAGLDADLLLVNGDPLADITALRHVRAVYLRGRRCV